MKLVIKYDKIADFRGIKIEFWRFLKLRKYLKAGYFWRNYLGENSIHCVAKVYE
jgi:hypothetical protein